MCTDQTPTQHITTLNKTEILLSLCEQSIQVVAQNPQCFITTPNTQSTISALSGPTQEVLFKKRSSCSHGRKTNGGKLNCSYILNLKSHFTGSYIDIILAEYINALEVSILEEFISIGLIVNINCDLLNERFLSRDYITKAIFAVLYSYSFNDMGNLKQIILICTNRKDYDSLKLAFDYPIYKYRKLSNLVCLNSIYKLDKERVVRHIDYVLSLDSTDSKKDINDERDPHTIISIPVPSIMTHVALIPKDRVILISQEHLKTKNFFTHTSSNFIYFSERDCFKKSNILNTLNFLIIKIILISFLISLIYIFNIV